MASSCYLTGAEAVGLVQNGDKSLVEVIKEHHQRYDVRNGTIKAWIQYKREPADEVAFSVPEGSLRGMIIGVKDLMGEYKSGTSLAGLIADQSTA